MGRISVSDVFAHIAQELQANGNDGHPYTSESFLAGSAFDLRLSITTDLQETEAFYLQRYGHGITHHFKLADYEHGKTLAGQIYWIMLGKRPDLEKHTGERFKPGEQLYLFIHVRDLEPPPRN